MKMYIIGILNKFEIILSDKTPKNVKMEMKNMKLISDKPMIIKFKKRI